MLAHAEHDQARFFTWRVRVRQLELARVMAGAQQMIEGGAQCRIGQIAQGNSGGPRIDLTGKVVQCQRQRDAPLGPAQIAHQVGFACKSIFGSAPAVAGGRQSVRHDLGAWSGQRQRQRLRIAHRGFAQEGRQREGCEQEVARRAIALEHRGDFGMIGGKRLEVGCDRFRGIGGRCPAVQGLVYQSFFPRQHHDHGETGIVF